MKEQTVLMGFACVKMVSKKSRRYGYAAGDIKTQNVREEDNNRDAK